MGNPQATGDYFRNIIRVIEDNIIMLQGEAQTYGKIRKFLLGINRNLQKRRRQRDYYKNLLDEYIKDGRAI